MRDYTPSSHKYHSPRFRVRATTWTRALPSWVMARRILLLVMIISLSVFIGLWTNLLFREFRKNQMAPSADGLLGLYSGSAYGAGIFFPVSNRIFQGVLQSSYKENAVALGVVESFSGVRAFLVCDHDFLAVVPLEGDF